MIRRALFLAALLVSAEGITCQAVQEMGIPEEELRKDIRMISTYADEMIEENRMEDYACGGFSWDTERRETSWRYFNGFVIDALLMFKWEEAACFADEIYQANIRGDGLIWDYQIGFLDPVEMGRGLFDLLDTSMEADRYGRAIQWIYTQLELQTTYKDCGGNYLHQQNPDGSPGELVAKYEIFLDGMYMTQPFLMECACAIKEGKLVLYDRSGTKVTSRGITDSVMARYRWMDQVLFHSDIGLMQHGYSREDRSGNGHFWGRGIGWYAMSLVDVARKLPEGEDKETCLAMLQRLLDGMLPYRDQKTGLWHNVVNRGEDLLDNRLETSVSAMMSYALLCFAELTDLDAERYRQMGLATLDGIVKNKMVFEDGKYHVEDTYQKSGVGETDEYYCTQEYTRDEAKGIGALFMAAAMAEQTLQKG